MTPVGEVAATELGVVVVVDVAAMALAAVVAAAVDKDGENTSCNAEEDTSSSAVGASWPWRRQGTASPSIAADTVVVVETIGGGVEGPGD